MIEFGQISKCKRNSLQEYRELILVRIFEFFSNYHWCHSSLGKKNVGGYVPDQFRLCFPNVFSAAYASPSWQALLDILYLPNNYYKNIYCTIITMYLICIRFMIVFIIFVHNINAFIPGICGCIALHVYLEHNVRM